MKGQLAGHQFMIPPLPTGVSITQVYTDMLGWLIKQTKEFFKESIPDGKSIWEKLSSRITFILAIPNGWDIDCQHILWDALTSSGNLSSADEERLEFVTEGEASVQYVLKYAENKSGWLKEGLTIAVMDAGGSTVDSTLYVCKQITPTVQLEEVPGSECALAGSVLVNQAMERVLREILAGSRYSSDGYISKMIAIFEKDVKPYFGDTQPPYLIEFGGPNDDDQRFNIRGGDLALAERDIERAFAGVIPRIEESCFRLFARGTVEVCEVQTVNLDTASQLETPSVC